jgi:hypothetical protein
LSRTEDPGSRYLANDEDGGRMDPSASQMWRRREHGQVLLEYGKVASIKSAIDFRERIERCINTADNGVLVLARRTNSDLVIACGVQKIDQAASTSVWSILRGLHHPYSRAWLTSDRLLPPFRQLVRALISALRSHKDPPESPT